MASAIITLRNAQSPKDFMETIKSLTKEGKEDLKRKEEELITNATLATICSHNTDEAITSATTIAKFIYLAKKGYSKEEAIFIASCELARQTLFMYKNKIGITNANNYS